MLDGALIDFAIVAILAVATAAGLSRGWLRELLTLSMWLLLMALVIGHWDMLSALVAPWLPELSLRITAVVLAAVVISAITLWLFDLAIRRLRSSLRFSGHDPVLGLLAGAARGIALIMIGVVLAHRTVLPERLAWRQSQLVNYAESLALELRPHLPQQLAQQIVLRGTQEPQHHLLIPRDARGHYLTRLWVNGLPVEALVDTGATMVMVPSHLADELGLSAGESFPVNTATGESQARHTIIEAMKLGPIVLYDVPAALVDSPKDTVLIGMSFLLQTRFEQNAEGLRLERARSGLE